jgi:hypothetical protein
MSCLNKSKRVSFNDVVTLFPIPGRTDEESENSPRVLGLAEKMYAAVKTMNAIDSTLRRGLGAPICREDDAIQRMMTSIETSALADAISGDYAVEHLVVNTDIRGVCYDDADIRDKVALDFVNSIIDGVTAKPKPGAGEEMVAGNTLHVFVDPSPHEMIDVMEHCLVVNTTGRRGVFATGSPAFQAFFDVFVDT